MCWKAPRTEMITINTSLNGNKRMQQAWKKHVTCHWLLFDSKSHSRLPLSHVWDWKSNARLCFPFSAVIEIWMFDGGAVHSMALRSVNAVLWGCQGMCLCCVVSCVVLCCVCVVFLYCVYISGPASWHSETAHTHDEGQPHLSRPFLPPVSLSTL